MLQAGAGSWRGRSASYSFQWKRCDRRGGKCEAVSGATGSFYLVGNEDVGHTLRVSVSARNKYGSTTATSSPKRVGPPTSTGPPAKGSVSFDGSARKMERLYSVGAANQGQSPHLWTCLCFNNNSMSLVSDSTYGKAYKVAVGPGDRNPWNTAAPASNAAGQVSKRRDNDLGKWDWYAIAVRVDAWADMATQWADIISVGYQTSAGDQVRLGLMNNKGNLYFEVSQNSGYANNPNGHATGSVHYTQPILPVTFGQWREFVVGIKWATDNTGAVQVYSRTPGGSWSKAFEKLNEPTYLYGTTSYGTFAQNGSNWPTVLDKLGLYYGGNSTSFPTETVYESGLTRSSDLATAKATLG
jgi:Polysaccharide lyase